MVTGFHYPYIMLFFSAHVRQISTSALGIRNGPRRMVIESKKVWVFPSMTRDETSRGGSSWECAWLALNATPQTRLARVAVALGVTWETMRFHSWIPLHLIGFQLNNADLGGYVSNLWTLAIHYPVRHLVLQANSNQYPQFTIPKLLPHFTLDLLHAHRPIDLTFKFSYDRRMLDCLQGLLEAGISHINHFVLYFEIDLIERNMGLTSQVMQILLDDVPGELVKSTQRKPAGMLGFVSYGDQPLTEETSDCTVSQRWITTEPDVLVTCTSNKCGTVGIHAQTTKWTRVSSLSTCENVVTCKFVTIGRKKNGTEIYRKRFDILPLMGAVLRHYIIGSVRLYPRFAVSDYLRTKQHHLLAFMRVSHTLYAAGLNSLLHTVVLNQPKTIQGFHTFMFSDPSIRFPLVREIYVGWFPLYLDIFPIGFGLDDSVGSDDEAEIAGDQIRVEEEERAAVSMAIDVLELQICKAEDFFSRQPRLANAILSMEHLKVLAVSGMERTITQIARGLRGTDSTAQVVRKLRTSLRACYLGGGPYTRFDDALLAHSAGSLTHLVLNSVALLPETCHIQFPRLECLAARQGLQSCRYISTLVHMCPNLRTRLHNKQSVGKDWTISVIMCPRGLIARCALSPPQYTTDLLWAHQPRDLTFHIRSDNQMIKCLKGVPEGISHLDHLTLHLTFEFESSSRTTNKHAKLIEKFASLLKSLCRRVSIDYLELNVVFEDRSIMVLTISRTKFTALSNTFATILREKLPNELVTACSSLQHILYSEKILALPCARYLWSVPSDGDHMVVALHRVSKVEADAVKGAYDMFED
ncbi:hypothetical protein CERSUDRAFT_125305 [Gelatoporia subvermispora B]|uniref:Uncharacterized protein n=1 Tax=Ceriporiopsis subvermispora (strain B) TaxID=914234 RepID=M2R7R8_CERS8|nr:hypothetical protein CERSUDRAFT_125305 [Gelatoporia subvermispora B]